MVKEIKLDKGEMLIGKSLSKCVIDIINGVVNIDDVKLIRAGTCISTPEILESVIKTYCRGYMLSQGPWDGLDESECRDITYQLFFTNRVYQERVVNMYEAGYTPDFLERSTKIHRHGAEHWEIIDEEANMHGLR